MGCSASSEQMARICRRRPPAARRTLQGVGVGAMQIQSPQKVHCVPRMGEYALKNGCKGVETNTITTT